MLNDVTGKLQKAGTGFKHVSKDLFNKLPGKSSKSGRSVTSTSSDPQISTKPISVSQSSFQARTDKPLPAPSPVKTATILSTSSSPVPFTSASSSTKPSLPPAASSSSTPIYVYNDRASSTGSNCTPPPPTKCGRGGGSPGAAPSRFVTQQTTSTSAYRSAPTGALPATPPPRHVLDMSEAELRRLLELHPQHKEAAYALFNLLKSQDRGKEASGFLTDFAYKADLAGKPDMASEGYADVGHLWASLSRTTEGIAHAAAMFRLAAEVSPIHASYYEGLARNVEAKGPELTRVESPPSNNTPKLPVITGAYRSSGPLRPAPAYITSSSSYQPTTYSAPSRQVTSSSSGYTPSSRLPTASRPSHTTSFRLPTPSRPSHTTSSSDVASNWDGTPRLTATPFAAEEQRLLANLKFASLDLKIIFALLEVYIKAGNAYGAINILGDAMVKFRRAGQSEKLIQVYDRSGDYWVMRGQQNKNRDPDFYNMAAAGYASAAEFHPLGENSVYYQKAQNAAEIRDRIEASLSN